MSTELSNSDIKSFRAASINYDCTAVQTRASVRSCAISVGTTKANLVVTMIFMGVCLGVVDFQVPNCRHFWRHGGFVRKRKIAYFVDQLLDCSFVNTIIHLKRNARKYNNLFET